MLYRDIACVFMMTLWLSGVHAAPPEGKAGDLVITDQPPEAVSLLGKPLHAPALSVETRARLEQRLEAARFEYDRDPHNEDAIIWVGRRLAYLGRYRDAIDMFSNGLAIHPQSHKLRRHRGHRYITLRMFEQAREDLERAAELIESREIADEVEPDGAPNRLGFPTSTSHTNIYYHLGLANYLRGDYQRAAEAYRKCMEFSKNDDMRIATAYWQYLTLRRLQRDDDAKRVLDGVRAEMEIIENTSYHRLLLMFKGDLPPEDVMPAVGGGDTSIDLATTGYGVGMFHLFNGDRQKAMVQFQRVIDETNWAAFDHLAAEAEVARARPER